MSFWVVLRGEEETGIGMGVGGEEFTKLKPKSSKGACQAARNASVKALRWGKACCDLKAALCKFFLKSQIINV